MFLPDPPDERVPTRTNTHGFDSAEVSSYSRFVKTNLLGLSPERLEALVTELQMPRYRARQIAQWLYGKHAASLEEMSNLSIADRRRLAEVAEVRGSAPLEERVSADGTKKYAFLTDGGDVVEAAMIPEGGRRTLCLSSQVGCRVGCRFCATGAMRLRGNLSAGEILNQYRSIAERDRITNIVYMGMGEPLDNLPAVIESARLLTAKEGYGLSNRRITLSTVGKPAPLARFLENCDVRLAISLHTPFQEQRRELMPGTRGYALSELMELLRRRAHGDSRRVTFEYVMLNGVNDSLGHADATAELLSGMRTRVNLIPFHPWDGNDMVPSPSSQIERFRARLELRGVAATVRASRGLDIDAACGLLATKHPGSNTD